jgi:hypothetical protein
MISPLSIKKYKYTLKVIFTAQLVMARARGVLYVMVFLHVAYHPIALYYHIRFRFLSVKIEQPKNKCINVLGYIT